MYKFSQNDISDCRILTFLLHIYNPIRECTPKTLQRYRTNGRRYLHGNVIENEIFSSNDIFLFPLHLGEIRVLLCKQVPSGVDK